ncbi:hypothetical protein [Sphingomonas sp. Leaf4]|uniref:hypothetical protein n=1 Tax=Sphingomonas sp. Leaf4 TaxID=2876553 RepID=UPI001E48FF07|nr:hypothetical protein [Sphingomonas sp. Leaf4]
MPKLFWLLASCVILVGCGGGGTGNVSTPAPSPTPTPTPSSSPSPTPLAFVGEVSAPLVGSITFTDANGTATVATGRDGVAPAGTNPLPGSPILQPGAFAPNYSAATFTLTGTGLEVATGYLTTQTAPVGATTISPLTSLIAVSGSQTVVRSAMLLNTGDGYALPASLDLLTYSATRPQAANEAAQTRGALIAANLRVRALSQALNLMSLPTIDQTIIPQVPANKETMIGNWLKANPSARLFIGNGTEQFLRGNVTMSGIYPIYDETYAAVAHLINIYASALKMLETQPDAAQRYNAALQGFLSEEIRRVMRFNFNDRAGNLELKAATTRALTLTTQNVTTAVSALDVPAAANTGLFFPGIDFIPISGGASVIVSQRDARLRPSATGAHNPSFGDNDYVWNPTTLKFDIDERLALTGVAVPAAFAGKLAISSTSATAFTIQPVGGFTGIGYVDLSITSGNGETRTERVFVIAS